MTVHEAGRDHRVAIAENGSVGPSRAQVRRLAHCDDLPGCDGDRTVADDLAPGVHRDDVPPDHQAVHRVPPHHHRPARHAGRVRQLAIDPRFRVIVDLSLEHDGGTGGIDAVDALAHHRRAMHLPALSIDWGAWAEVGLAAADDKRGARLMNQGLTSMQPADAATAFASGSVMRSANV